MLLEFCRVEKIEIYSRIEFGLLFMLSVVGVISYGIILGGFIRGAKYAFIASVRRLIQVISYEVVFTLVLYFVCHSYKTLEVSSH